MKKVGDVRCYVIPKKKFLAKQAMVVFNYGSCDNDFIVNNEVNHMPIGIAHFLEHKLFEDEFENVFDQFGKLGANVNAYTNFNSTAYYFNTIDNFMKNFRILLEFVSTPYFTKENVEKEKGIIKQEIKMYDDDPMWGVYFNMLKAMYKGNPVKENIAGSVESIDNINEDMLYKCYETFYNKANAAVICSTDTDKEEVFEAVEKYLCLNDSKDIQRIYGEEDNNIAEKQVIKNMGIERNIFNIGFKDTDFSGTILDRIYDTKISLDLIAGKSSNLYEKLYSMGLIDNSFNFDYSAGLNYGFSVFSGFSDNPQEVRKYLIEEIENIKANGIEEEAFRRIRDKHIGGIVKGFNSIESIINAQADLFTKKIEFKDTLAKYRNTDKDKVHERIKSHLNEDVCVSSLIVPN